MAQRKRAGLIILRSVVRTHFPVVLTSIALQKLFVKLDVKRSTHYRCGAEEARKAHNLEDT